MVVVIGIIRRKLGHPLCVCIFKAGTVGKVRKKKEEDEIKEY